MASKNKIDQVPDHACTPPLPNRTKPNRCDRDFTVIERVKFETVMPDLVIFLDQPDKIKIENKIQNHAKDLSSKKKTAESNTKCKNDQTNRKDGENTSFLSSQIFLDID